MFDTAINLSENTKKKELNDSPINVKTLTGMIFLGYFIAISSIASFLFFVLDDRIKAIWYYGVGTLGISTLLTGLTLSIAFMIFSYKKPEGAFGLYMIIGLATTVYAALIYFMQKVG